MKFKAKIAAFHVLSNRRSGKFLYEGQLYSFEEKLVIFDGDNLYNNIIIITEVEFTNNLNLPLGVELKARITGSYSEEVTFDIDI